MRNCVSQFNLTMPKSTRRLIIEQQFWLELFFLIKKTIAVEFIPPAAAVSLAVQPAGASRLSRVPRPGRWHQRGGVHQPEPDPVDHPDTVSRRQTVQWPQPLRSLLVPGLAVYASGHIALQITSAVTRDGQGNVNLLQDCITLWYCCWHGDLSLTHLVLYLRPMAFLCQCRLALSTGSGLEVYTTICCTSRQLSIGLWPERRAKTETLSLKNGRIRGMVILHNFSILRDLFFLHRSRAREYYIWVTSTLLPSYFISLCYFLGHSLAVIDCETSRSLLNLGRINKMTIREWWGLLFLLTVWWELKSADCCLLLEKEKTPYTTDVCSSVTHLTSSMRAAMLAAIGAEADVPENPLVHRSCIDVVICRQTRAEIIRGWHSSD